MTPAAACAGARAGRAEVGLVLQPHQVLAERVQGRGHERRLRALALPAALERLSARSARCSRAACSVRARCSSWPARVEPIKPPLRCGELRAQVCLGVREVLLRTGVEEERCSRRRLRRGPSAAGPLTLSVSLACRSCSRCSLNMAIIALQSMCVCVCVCVGGGGGLRITPHTRLVTHFFSASAWLMCAAASSL